MSQGFFEDYNIERILIGIALLLLIGAVWRIWKHIRRQYQHLDDHDIEDLLAGRLEGSDLKIAREHILFCEDCKARMDEMSSESIKMKPGRWMKRRF